jgi:hypothetical protein
VSDDVSDAFPEPDDTAPQDDHLDDSMDDPQDDSMGDGPDGFTADGFAEDLDGTEAHDPQHDPDLSAVAPPAEVAHTGNPVVDSVLDSLRELDRLPVSEHVAVFEAAHDRLRGALSDAGDPPADA